LIACLLACLLLGSWFSNTHVPNHHASGPGHARHARRGCLRQHPESGVSLHRHSFIVGCQRSHTLPPNCLPHCTLWRRLISSHLICSHLSPSLLSHTSLISLITLFSSALISPIALSHLNLFPSHVIQPIALVLASLHVHVSRIHVDCRLPFQRCSLSPHRSPRCHVKSCRVVSCHVMSSSCRGMSCHVVSCLDMSSSWCHGIMTRRAILPELSGLRVLPCLVMSWLGLSCLVLSCVFLSCLVLSCHVMSCHVVTTCHDKA
jgi:hypothetical protein